MILKFLKRLFTRKKKEVVDVRRDPDYDLPTFSIRNKEGVRIPLWKVGGGEMKAIFDSYRREAENTADEQSKEVH